MSNEGRSDTAKTALPFTSQVTGIIQLLKADGNEKDEKYYERISGTSVEKNKK